MAVEHVQISDIKYMQIVKTALLTSCVVPSLF